MFFFRHDYDSADARFFRAGAGGTSTGVGGGSGNTGGAIDAVSGTGADGPAPSR